MCLLIFQVINKETRLSWSATKSGFDIALHLLAMVEKHAGEVSRGSWRLFSVCDVNTNFFNSNTVFGSFNSGGNLSARSCHFTMNSQWPSSQYSPGTVLISHILDSYSHFQACPLDHRIRIRFLFEQLLYRLIDINSFWRIADFLDNRIRPAAEIVVTLATNPEKLRPGDQSRWWTNEETCILLFGYFTENRDLVCKLLPHRPKKYWAKHVTHVITKLERGDLLNELVCRKEEIVETSETWEDCTILVEDLKFQLKLCRKRNKQCTAKLMRKTRVFWRRLQALRAKNACLSKRVLQLEKCLLELSTENDDEIDQPDQILTSSSLMETVLSECSHLNSLSSTHTYSDLLRDIGQLIVSTSPKTYRVLRQILPLPSVTCLHAHYSDVVSGMRKQFKDETMIHERVLSGIEPGSVRMISSLCIDAFAVRTFTAGCSLGPSGTVESKYSNVFLFMQVPLDSNYPVRVVHLQPKNSGSFDGSVEARACHIREMFQKNGHPIWFQATDGDPYLNRIHKAFYKKHLKGRTKNDFTVIIQKIHDALIQGETMPIADPLHFAKNIRGKLVDHDVAIALSRSENGNTARTTNAMLLEEHLKLGQALTDISQVGRMRDIYVVRIFTLENVLRLLRANEYHAALLLFPYACLFTILYSENLSNSCRMMLVTLAYLSFRRLYKEAKSLVAAKIGVMPRYTKSAKSVTIAEPIHFKRILHTCLAFGIALRFGPRNVRLDAIGTHLVENAIGTARSISNSPDFDAILTAFAKSEVRKAIARKYGISLYVPKRINDGGAKVDTLNEDGLHLSETLDPHDTCSLLMEHATGFNTSNLELDSFLTEFTSFVAALHLRRFSTPSDVANALIVERNRKFQSK